MKSFAIMSHFKMGKKVQFIDETLSLILIKNI